MSEDKDRLTGNLLFFLAGAAIGAVAVALLTPRTGPELRADLKAKARALKDLLEEAKDLM